MPNGPVSGVNISGRGLPPLDDSRTRSNPLTAAQHSEATTIPEVIAELLASKASERSGRLVDSDQVASMERKKAEGYF